MIEKLLKRAKEEKLDLEIYSIKNNETTIEYLEEKMVNFKIQNIKKYKIKAIVDGIAVEITTLDISSPDDIIEQLKIARKLTDELDEVTLATKEKIELKDRKVLSFDTNEIKNNLKSFNHELKEKYSEVFSIRSEFNFEQDDYEIYNTNGTNLKDSNYHAYYYTDVVLKINEQNLEFYRFLMDKNLDFEKFKRKVEEDLINTLNKVGAKSIVTDKYDILLENKSVYDILNALAMDFHARNISKKQSVFTDKLGEKIFSNKINIVEDPANDKLIGTRLFDDEGVKTYFKKIVDKGVFTTELYDKKYARKDNVKSTGNSYGVRNLYIEPGKKSEDELLEKVEKGIYVEKLLGIHSGINHLTGDMSIQCEGFKIENGKKTIPVNQIVLSTNIFELFGNVKEIANNLEFFGSTGGAPSMLINNITIAGKEE